MPIFSSFSAAVAHPMSGQTPLVQRLDAAYAVHLLGGFQTVHCRNVSKIKQHIN